MSQTPFELLLKMGTHIHDPHKKIKRLRPGDVVIRRDTSFVMQDSGHLMAWSQTERCFLELPPSLCDGDIVLQAISNETVDR